MGRAAVLTELEALAGMRRDLVERVQVELRDGNRVTPYRRLEKIRAWWGKDIPGVTGVGGTSSYIAIEKGRPKEQPLIQTSVIYLEQGPNRWPRVALYSMGIIGTTDSGLPIFDGQPGEMQSLGLQTEPSRLGVGLLNDRAEPLFNIHADGTVLARCHDQPTPIELQLFYDLLAAYEGADNGTGQQ